MIEGGLSAVVDSIKTLSAVAEATDDAALKGSNTDRSASNENLTFLQPLARNF
jgi:hypothetical protein